MKLALFLSLSFILSSCAVYDLISGKTAIDQRLAELARQDRAREELRHQRQAEEKIQQDQEQAILRKISLSNTINLKIGFTQEAVMALMLNPNSVSAVKDETVWHYDLYKYADKNSAVVPFKVIFKNNKLASFGIDQEQVERNKAHVVIQREMANEKQTP